MVHHTKTAGSYLATGKAMCLNICSVYLRALQHNTALCHCRESSQLTDRALSFWFNFTARPDSRGRCFAIVNGFHNFQKSLWTNCEDSTSDASQSQGCRCFMWRKRGSVAAHAHRILATRSFARPFRAGTRDEHAFAQREDFTCGRSSAIKPSQLRVPAFCL